MEEAKWKVITQYLCGCGKKRAENLEENRKALQDKWEDLVSIREDVKTIVEEVDESGRMQISHGIYRWLEEVERIQMEIKDIQDQGAQAFKNKCLSCGPNPELEKIVAKMLTKVDALTAEGERYDKDVQIAHKLPFKPIDITSVETVGLDLMFEKVWNSIEKENVGVIGLYGIGGVGKTTLLKKINNELAIRKSKLDFVVIWVVVSKEPNLDSIMDNIRKLIGIGDFTWNYCNNPDEKVAKIYGVLKQRKFVLLLDDIWERLDLNMVGVPHPMHTNFQSKVLFTTRLKDVCEKMQAQRTFKVEVLREKEALELFCLKVGEETLRSHPNIPKLAKEMAMECEGLPLALIVVGSAMTGVKSVEAWEHSKNNLMSSSSTALNLETKVFSTLKFGYNQLPDEVHKNCFLYCALYPENYEIEVSDLIDKWIGEGFLYKDLSKSMHDMRDDCKSVIITKLKLSCLLESVEDEIDEYQSVKMHDMVLDMALWIARDQEKRMKRVLVQGDAIAVSHDDFEQWEFLRGFRSSKVKNGMYHVQLVPISKHYC